MAQRQRSYRGISADDRKAERRRKLLDAAFELVGTKGLAATTMTEVCASARLTERYFYENFRNLDELVAAVMTEQAARVRVLVLEAMARIPQDQPERSVRTAVTTFLELTDADPRVRKVILAESLGSPALRVERHIIVRQFAELVAEHARSRYGDRMTQARARLGGVLLVGGLAEILMARQSGELEVTGAEVVDVIVDQFDALADK